MGTKPCQAYTSLCVVFYRYLYKFADFIRLARPPTFSKTYRQLFVTFTPRILAQDHLGVNSWFIRLHGPSTCAVKAKIIECYIIKPAQSLLMKHLVIGQR